MNKKISTFLIALLLALCTGATGFYAGKAAGQGELQVEQQVELQGEQQVELQGEQQGELQGDQQEELQGELQIALERLHQLNRASIENVIIEKEPIYVIGHMSPDSDTVCSAIAYAKLLTALGYPAEPRITMPVNNESAYILKEAGTEVPPVLKNAAGCSIFLVDHSEYMQAAEVMLSYEGMSSEEIFFSDYKEYEAGGIRYGIGVLNAIDDETAMKLAEQMKEALPECFSKKNVDLMYASVGIRENGEKIDRIVPANEQSAEVFKKAFPNYDEFDGTSFLFRNGLGRKTLFVPGMTEYLNSNPQ